MRAKASEPQEASGHTQRFLTIGSRLLVAALAAWAALALAELILLFGAMRVFALVLSPDLLPSLKVVLDMGALAICGWVAGRVGAPHVWIAAGLAAAGLSVYDFTPYLPLNVPWLFRLAENALGDARYLPSLGTTLTIHALMLGSLFAGAQLSRPGKRPMALEI